MIQQLMRTTGTVILAAIFSIKAFSQSVDTKISGTVKDVLNEAVAGATVNLLNVKDSASVQIKATDIKGRFQFTNLINGNYLLIVTATGHKTYRSGELTLDDLRNRVAMPVISLVPIKDKLMTEVVIKAKRPLMVHEVDKTVIHVEAMISSATSNTLEVLERTPGVSVSPAGEISLNGKTGVVVLIDGRSTYMSGPDLAGYLKSLPGGLVDKLELIDNPSAKYDASGGAIINIRLKKNRIGGFTGNISTSYIQGRYARSYDAINMNYNYRKLNIFTNIGYNNDKYFTGDIYDRRYYAPSGELSSSLDLINNQLNSNRGINVNTGFDFALGNKTTIGSSVNISQSKRNGKLEYTSQNYNALKEPGASSYGKNFSRDKRKNFGANLNFLHRFNDKGRELSADFNYYDYESRSMQNLKNYYDDHDGRAMTSEAFLYRLPADARIYAGKADYTHPLKNKAGIDAGIKSSFVNNENVANYYNIENSTQIFDNTKSNHFRYTENITAAYINTQKTWKRFAVQLGVRLENTHAVGRQLGNDSIAGSSFTKNYTGMFPGAYLNYSLDSSGNNSFNLSVVRRINRPSYQLLNPFLLFRDQYSYYSGNPLLVPQYQSRIELKFRHKQLLNMGLSYNRFTHVIFQTTESVDEVFITRPQNIASGFMLLLNTNISYSPTAWWLMNYTLRFSHMGLNGKAYTEDLNPRANVARLEINNYFTLNKGWTAEAGGYYASSDLNGQTKTSGNYRVQAAFQKKILKDKGSIRLSAEDIFHTWIYHNRSLSLKQADYLQTTDTDTQKIGIAFTYRFGQDNQNKKRRNNSNASDDEKERIQ